MDIILIPFLTIFNALIGLYIWIVIASVVLSWLVAYNVVNKKNNFVVMIMDFLGKATEPLLYQIRRVLPILGGFDLSPLVLIVILWFIQAIIGRLIFKLIMVSGG